MRSAPSTYRPLGDENNRVSFPGRRGSGPHATTLLEFSEAPMQHGPWTPITTRLDGKAVVVECDACGIRVIRIHAASPVVSQPECTLVPAGADGSTRP